MKTPVLIFLSFLFTIISCTESPLPEKQLPGIDGTYRGGTLIWSNRDGSTGADPNFTFTVSSPAEDSIDINLNTTAPGFPENYHLRLYYKIVDENTGHYIFFDSWSEGNIYYSLNLMITTPKPTKSFAEIEFSTFQSGAQYEHSYSGRGFQE